MAKSKTVVITGAGGGIGRALSVGFCRDHWRVVGLGRGAEALAATQALCADGLFGYRLADVIDPVAVGAAVAAIAAECGAIDALICGAAVYPRAYFLDQPAEDWASALMTNVVGVANCCRAVLPDMLARNDGRIVVIGSLADLNPIPASSAYAASKAALHCLVKALAGEIDPGRYPNVLINEFNPSATRTGMSDTGDDPSVVYPRVKRLVDFPSGGPSGRLFLRDKEFVRDAGVKATLKRLLRGPFSRS